MNYLDVFLRITCFQVFRNQASMTLFWCVFRAKEATLVESLNRESLSDMTLFEKIVEDDGIAVPIDDLVLVILKKRLRWC